MPRFAAQLSQAAQFAIALQETRDINVIVGRPIAGGTGFAFYRAKKENEAREVEECAGCRSKMAFKLQAMEDNTADAIDRT